MNLRAGFRLVATILGGTALGAFGDADVVEDERSRSRTGLRELGNQPAIWTERRSLDQVSVTSAKTLTAAPRERPMLPG